MEARLTARRSENLLAMVGIPIAALVFFSTVGVGGTARGIAELLPASLALALVASGLVNLGIATAFERGYGVLKRLGSAPLGRGGLLVAKVAVVAIIGIAQVVALLVLAALLGWRPSGAASWTAVALVTVISVGAFAAVGLLLAGTLRPEAVLVVANVLFLAAILFGGIVVAVDGLPGPLATAAALLPWGAAGEAFRAALDGGDLLDPWRSSPPGASPRRSGRSARSAGSNAGGRPATSSQGGATGARARRFRPTGGGCGVAAFERWSVSSPSGGWSDALRRWPSVAPASGGARRAARRADPRTRSERFDAARYSLRSTAPTGTVDIEGARGDLVERAQARRPRGVRVAGRR